jgi:hypothetical protein
MPNPTYEFSFKRRRYGRTTYTWAFVKYGSDWLSLGDPWPCLTPKRSELTAQAELVLRSVATA